MLQKKKKTRMHFLRYLWVFEIKCESSRSKIIQFGLNNLHERGGVKKKREDVRGGQGRGDGRCWERREGLSWLGEKRDVREIAGEGGREC